MGGRGANGSRGKSGSGGGAALASAKSWSPDKLPALDGSPEQVSWAESIRDKELSLVDKHIDRILTEAEYNLTDAKTLEKAAKHPNEYGNVTYTTARGAQGGMGQAYVPERVAQLRQNANNLGKVAKDIQQVRDGLGKRYRSASQWIDIKKSGQHFADALPISSLLERHGAAFRL